MTMIMFTSAAALSDGDLLSRLHLLAAAERRASAELVAHLAVLYKRPSVYAAQGYGSLFAYCTEALGLSEDAACNRIDVAKTCSRFPNILDLLASGSMTPSAVRALARYLTDDNHQDVLERAKGRTGPQIKELIAEIAPRPDVKSTMRKLPSPTTAQEPEPSATVGQLFGDAASPAPPPPSESSPLPPPTVSTRSTRSVVEPTAPDRYRVQFTIGGATREKLLRLQALLRREVPSGDPALIVDQALTVLLAKVEKEKLGAASKPRPGPIRSETDNAAAEGKTRLRSRTIPREVKRVTWRRDGGQCAFVSAEGRRCTEHTFLEFHHVRPFAHDGPATVDNIALRCRRHNQYEADLVFGARGPSHEWEEAEASIRTPPRMPRDH
jgi:hypothetical protein